MAERRASKKSEDILQFYQTSYYTQINNIHNTHSENDLTLITSGLQDSTNYISNKPSGDSIAHLGSVHALDVPIFRSKSIPAAHFDSHHRTHPTLPLTRQLSLPNHSVALEGQPQFQPIGDYTGNKQLSVATSSVESRTAGVVIAESSRVKSVDLGAGEEKRDFKEETEYNEFGDDDHGVDNNKDNHDTDASEACQDEYCVDMAGRSTSYRNDNLAVEHADKNVSSEDSEISSRTMVVMARTQEGALQCVSMCQHPGTTSREYRAMSTSHVPVFSAEDERQETISGFPMSVVIKFDSQNSTLRNRCWINCELVWTVRSSTLYLLEGEVTNFKVFLGHFTDVQEKLYKRVKNELDV